MVSLLDPPEILRQWGNERNTHITPEQLNRIWDAGETRWQKTYTTPGTKI